MTCIVGWGHTPFGKHAEKSVEELLCAAGAEALLHAGIAAEEIDGIWIGHFNAGMVADGFPSSLALSIDPALRFCPATRLENACASGSAAVFAAKNAIEAGQAKIALVIGVEKMTHLSTPDVSSALGHASYQAEEGGFTFPQVFARFAQAYFQKYGDKSGILAEIAAKNHQNAMSNPLAQLRKPLTVEFCSTVSDRNPMVAAPLKVTDCSLISDGAAAIVMVSDDVARSMQRAVRFRAAAHVSDYLPMSQRDITAFEGPREAIRRAKASAGVGSDDIHVAEVHDCFTIAELMIYEALELAPPGQGERAVRDGTVFKGGRLPVNLSGGLKAKGHPVGATGVSMHVMVSRQLTSSADDMQVPNASLGLVFNMGGSAVANYCSILEAERL